MQIRQHERHRASHAFRDCVATVLRENAVKQVDTDEELLAFRNKLKERKGTGT